MLRGVLESRSTRPDAVGADGWPVVQRSVPERGRPVGAVWRTLQAVGSIVGVQVLAVGVCLLVVSSYRRAAAGWVLPLVGVLDVLVSVQIAWLAVRDIRLAGKGTVGARVVLAFVVVGMPVGAGVGGLAVQRYMNRPVDGAFDSAVMDRDLRLTATEFRCGGKVRRVVVRGTLCRVSLAVANTGSVEARFEAGVQRLREEEAEYRGSTLVVGRQRRPVWEVKPGAEVRGVLVFDVPRGTVPRSLELRAEADSRGVRLPVS
ncbi:DUF4352 domain-containing protein [Actinomadura spongiicola]|uniref:DUF4352 domain-containing protein n=1 Tax=Actinomadura spongiicola TaxID=2303421 RepID=A0A372GLI2_9ACTN|nr:DUF4352 domain-containing protein [Actinomadura spongiicola]